MSIIVEQLLIIFCTFVSSNRYSAEYHTIIIMGALHYSNHLREVQIRYSGSAKRLLMSVDGAVVETPPSFLY